MQVEKLKFERSIALGPFRGIVAAEKSLSEFFIACLNQLGYADANKLREAFGLLERSFFELLAIRACEEGGFRLVTDTVDILVRPFYPDDDSFQEDLSVPSLGGLRPPEGATVFRIETNLGYKPGAGLTANVARVNPSVLVVQVTPVSQEKIDDVKEAAETAVQEQVQAILRALDSVLEALCLPLEQYRSEREHLAQGYADALAAEVLVAPTLVIGETQLVIGSFGQEQLDDAVSRAEIQKVAGEGGFKVGESLRASAKSQVQWEEDRSEYCRVLLGQLDGELLSDCFHHILLIVQPSVRN